MEAANGFLRTHWIPYHNQNFTVAAEQSGTAFVPYAGSDLNKIFSHQEERVVGNDNTVSFGKLSLQIQRQTFRFSMARCRVLVCQHLDRTLSFYCGPHVLGRYNTQGEILSAVKSARRRIRAGLGEVTGLRSGVFTFPKTRTSVLTVTLSARAGD